MSDPYSESSLETVPVLSCAASPDETAQARGGCAMSLGDHIMELRARLILCLLVFLVAFIPAAILCYHLYDWALLPLQWAGADVKQVVNFQFEGPWKGVALAFRLALYASAVLVMPFWIYQGWRFVGPGLTGRERRAAIPVFTAGSVLFLVGAAVAFCYAVPLGLNFLVDFNKGFGNTQELWKPEMYFSFITLACLGFGVGFETPLVMMALARVGLITPAGIMRYWRQSVLGIVVLGAVLTPPDPMTQILLAAIMIVLFFLGYALACWVAPAPERDRLDA